MTEQLDSQAIVSPVNVQEFSKKVKEKYPEYKDVDDLTLAQKIVEKYPEYKDRVSFDQPEATGTPPQTQPEQPLTYMQKELRQKFPENYTEEQPQPIQQEVKPLGKVDQLKVDYLRKTRGDEFANQEQSKMQATEQPEEQGFAGKLGKTVGNSFMTGMNSLNSWAADAPGFIYDLAGAPFRAVGLNVPTSQDFKDTPLQNISSFYKDNAKAYEQKVQEANPSRGQGVVASFEKGDIEGGILNLAGGIAESAPASIAMMLSGGATAPTILGGAAIFGAGKAQEMDQNAPEMDYDKRRVVAALNGTLEGIFETYLGSGAVGKSLAGIIRNEGKEVAQEQAKRSLSTVFADMITKNPWMAPLGEGFEEIGTQISQNLVDKYSGYKPDLDIMDGVGDSFLSGVGMGGIHGAVIGLAKSAMDARNATPITTATIEGQQYTINNPEDLGIEGKPIFAKDAEGNVKAVPNHKAKNPITQTQGEIDQLEADQQSLMNGISDPNAKVVNEVNEDGIRLVKFSNGQSKIITPDGEHIANDQNEEDAILEKVINGEQVPEVKTPAPEKKVVSQTFGNSQIDIIENEDHDEIVPSDKMPLEKALPILEKKFKDNKKFKVVSEKAQVEEPGETKYDDPIKKTVIKSIKIVPVEVIEKQKAEADLKAKEQKQADTNILLEFIDEFNATSQSREDKQQASDIESIAKKLGYQIDRTPMNEIRLFDNSGTISKPEISQNNNSEIVNSEIVPEIKSDLSDTQQGENQLDVESLQKSQLENKELQNNSQQDEKPLESNPIHSNEGVANQGENTPQAQQVETVSEGLEENVIPVNEAPLAPMAADYLLTGGSGVILSSDYFIQGLSGVFTHAGAKIDAIRKKYAKEIAEGGFGDIKNFVGSDLYNKIISEIQNEVNTSYGNNTEIQDIFNQILQHPTGLPYNLGNQISIKIDELNSTINIVSTDQPVVESLTADPVAEEIAQQEVNLNPTEAQKESGNYKKAHIKVQGMDITIENPKGSIRKGVDEDGKAWENVLQSHYGYFKRTEGKDGDHIDVFIGENPESQTIYVIDKVFDKGDKSGLFDESKVMIGYNSPKEAADAYMANYAPDFNGLSDLTPVSVEDFKKWLYDGAKQKKPFADYKSTPDPVVKKSFTTEKSVNKPNTITGKAKEVEVAESDIQGLALQYFVNGGTVHPDEILRMCRDSKSERDLRKSYADKEGLTVAQIAHNIWQSLPESIQNGLTEMGIYNEVESVIQGYNTPTLMAQALLKKYSIDPNQGYSKEWLDAQIKKEDEERLSEIEVWNDYLSGLEINGQLPTENELIELFLPENTENGNQEINQRGSIESDRPANSKGNVEIGQNLQGSESGVNGENEGNPESQTERFGLKPTETLQDLSDNINSILEQYSGRRMAAIQVETYMSEFKPLGQQYLAENGIKTRDELKAHLAKLQAKVREGKGKERQENKKQFDNLRAEQAVSEIEKMALAAEAEMQKQIEESDRKKPLSEFLADSKKEVQVKKQSTPLPEEKQNDPIKKLESENKSTLPKIPVGKIFSNDVQAIPREARAEADKFIESNTFDQLPVESVDVSDIIPTQKNVTISNIKEVANVDLKPQLLKFQGKYYALDGHHRISNRILEGETTVEANVFDEDARLKAIEDRKKPLNTVLKEAKEQLESKRPKEAIEDFGEKLGGAKKDLIRKYLNKINLNGLTLSTIFPKPDIKELLASGMSNKEVSAIKVAYEFAQAEKKNTRRTKDTQIGAIRFCASYAKTVLAENLNIEFNNEGWVFTDHGKQLIQLRTSAFEKVAEELGTDFLSLDLSRFEIRELTPENTKHYVNKPEGNFEVQYYVNKRQYFQTLDEALNEFVDQVRKNTTANTVVYKRKLNIYYRRNGEGSYIGYQPSGKEVIILKDGFKNSTEAFEYKKENEADLQTMLERIMAEQKEANKKQVTRLKYYNETTRERVGNDWRKGKDIPVGQFADTFGFKSVEFGNWATQAERQVFLNNVYDSLMDLTEILNVPAKALSLNGELSISFGSRGSGGALAHYEPERKVINLTKNRGIGSLAHEFFHGLDNYFAGFKSSMKGMKSAVAGESMPETRQELKDQFRKLYDAFGSGFKSRSRSLDDTKNKNYFGLPHEMAARAFENYILNKLSANGQVNDFLVNYVSNEDWNGNASQYPYPIGEESKAIGEVFDKLFETIETKEEGDNVPMFRIIGEKGAASIDLEEEVTTRLDNLNSAREMEQAGKDAKTISLATGWEKGADGKWRYEVPDNIKPKRYVDKAKFAQAKTAYERIIELNKAKDYDTDRERLIKILEDFYKTTGVPYYTGDQSIHNALRTALLEDKPELLPEPTISHNIEFWQKKRVDGEALLEDVIDNEQMYNEYPFLRYVGISFKNIDSKGSYSPGSETIVISDRLKGYDEEVKSTMLHEIQHAIQYFEGFAKGGNLQSGVAELYDRINKQLNDLAREMNNLTVPGNYGKFSDPKGYELKEKYDALMQEKLNANPYDYYKRLAGEVESRNVQTRMNMTPEERRNALLQETEDVAREDQIVLMDGLGVSSLEESNPIQSTIDHLQSTDSNPRKVNFDTKENLIQYMKDNDYPQSILDQVKLINFGGVLIRGEIFMDSGNVNTPDKAVINWLHERTHVQTAENMTRPELVDFYHSLGPKEIRRVIPSFYWNKPYYEQADEYISYASEGLSTYGELDQNIPEHAKEIITNIVSGFTSPKNLKDATKSNNLDDIQSGNTRRNVRRGNNDGRGNQESEGTSEIGKAADGRSLPKNEKRSSKGLTVSTLASQDLSKRHNASNIITKLSNELGEQISVVNSSELPENAKDSVVLYDNGKLTIVSDRIESVSGVVKSILSEVATKKGLREVLVQANPDSNIGRQLPKFDELNADLSKLKENSPETERLAQIFRKAFSLTSGQFSNSDLLSIVKDQQTRLRVTDEKNPTINIDGIERSTLNSNGKPIANSEEGIRNFYRWFGDSKVVDSEGRPLVVYHGTNKEFSDFIPSNRGIWLTPDEKRAEGYAMSRNNGEKGITMPLYAKIEKISDYETNDEYVPYDKLGYDGWGSKKQNGEYFTIVVKSPSQIKSTGNNGSFSPESNDIRFRVQPIELPEGVKKVKGFKTEEGNFSYYDTEFAPRGRAQYFTVLEDKKGWIVRNVILPETEQGKGIATQTYRYLNQESLKKTGNPLRSSRPRIIKSTGEEIIELSKDGEKLWDRLVSKGFAIKTGDKQYEFIAPEDMVRFRVEQAVEDLNKINSLPKSNLSDLLKSVNETVEASMAEAHGIKATPLWERIKAKLIEIKESTQHFQHITEAEFPVVYDKLRQFEAIPDRVKKEAYERISEVIRPIAKNQQHFEAFERYIVLQDLVNDIENTELFANKDLPWGYNTVDEIKTDMRNVRTYVMRNPAVLKSVRDRQAMMKEVKQALVDNKLLKDNGNDKYFHHQVLAYMEGQVFPGVSSKDVRNHKKGWQRSRQGSIAAYNTNYLESEFEVLAQSLEQVAIKNILGELGAKTNIMPDLIKQAKQMGGSWRDYIPEGYKQWFPKQGTNAYKAASMAEKAVQNILNDPNSPDVAKFIAEVEGNMWVIPEPVAKQLDSMKDPEKEMIFPAALRMLTGKWKQWILLNPYSAIKYNFNNMSGDIDIVMAYDPTILKPKYAKTATTEAWNELRGKGMSQDMKEALQYGIITSGLSIQEIPDVNQQTLFKSVTKGSGNIAQKLWGATGGKYWGSVTDMSQFRENVLRLAAYKFFKEQIEAGKKPLGASNKKAIDALYRADTNSKEVAAKLARELLGDYGNLSQAGQWFRSHSYPFWSWVEINSPRYYRLLKNTKFEDNTGTLGRVAAVGTKKTAFNIGKLGVKAMLLMGLVVLWNRLMFPDEDDELQKQKDHKLKLIVGRREDGSIMTMKIQGAFSDMLSFFGLEDAVADVNEVSEGKSTVGKKLAEGGSAFVNKFAQGAMPLTKTLAEVATKKSFYPDILNPRSVRDRAEQGLKIFKMDKIYNYLTHKPARSFGKEVSGLLVYDNSPGEAAYYTMRQNIFDFMKDNGEEFPSGEPTDRSNALYYYKQSLKLGDPEKASFWFEKYKELGGTAKGYTASMKKGMIINTIPNDLKAAWYKSLDAEDKEVLDMANKWYFETYLKVGIPKKGAK